MNIKSTILNPLIINTETILHQLISLTLYPNYRGCEIRLGKIYDALHAIPKLENEDKISYTDILNNSWYVWEDTLEYIKNSVEKDDPKSSKIDLTDDKLHDVCWNYFNWIASLLEINYAVSIVEIQDKINELVEIEYSK